MSRMIAGGSYLLLRAQSAHLRTNYHGFGERKKEAGRGGKAVTELTDESAEQAEHAATLDSDLLFGASQDESGLAGARAGQLFELFEAAGLRNVEEATLSASGDYATFDEWWGPVTLGVGPAGDYAQALGEAELLALRALPEASFTLKAFARAARGIPAADG